METWNREEQYAAICEQPASKVAAKYRISAEVPGMRDPNNGGRSNIFWRNDPQQHVRPERGFRRIMLPFPKR